MASSAYEHDADGTKSAKSPTSYKFIPATQRPDGTWRKPRRVKEGYVPQEEVPLYESKGKQFLARQTGLPVGLTPEIAAAAQKPKKQNSHKEQNVIQPIPGMFINVEKTKKKKKKKSGPEEAAEKLAACSIISEPTFSETISSDKSTAKNPVSCQTDPAKKLKNLRKKLREIETLEEKIRSGTLKNPDKDQKEKISKKNYVIKQIEIIEQEIST